MFSKAAFSNRLSALRKNAKLSQSQLGEIAGISQFAISKIEKSERATSVEVLFALADYFDVPLDYLTGRGIFENWEKIICNREQVIASIEQLVPATRVFQFAQMDERALMHIFPAFLSRVEFLEDDTVVLHFHI